MFPVFTVRGEAASHVVIRKRDTPFEVLSRRRRRDELFGHLPRGRREPNVLLIFSSWLIGGPVGLAFSVVPAVVPDLGDEDRDDPATRTRAPDTSNHG